MEVSGSKTEERVVRCWPPKLGFTFGGFYICANFGENRSRSTNATMRVCTIRQMHRCKPVW